MYTLFGIAPFTTNWRVPLTRVTVPLLSGSCGPGDGPFKTIPLPFAVEAGKRMAEYTEEELLGAMSVRACTVPARVISKSPAQSPDFGNAAVLLALPEPSVFKSAIAKQE